MNFTNPEILFALVAVLIPIIVHLFNFRRYKKYYFSNVALLKDITIETKKKSQLKHLIVMFLRMLAIAALVIAFAGPDFNKNKKNISSDNISGIYIDNSFSMEASNREGRLFDHAVAAARQLIKHSKRDSKFLVLDNNKNGQRILNKDEALSTVDNIRISPSHKEMSTIVDEFLMFNSKNNNKSGINTFLLSDFQKSSFNTPEFKNDSLVNWNFVMMHHQETRNILIDSCWIEDPIILPQKITTIFVRLRNVSNKSYEKAGIKLFINGKNKSIASVDLNENSEKIIKMQFNTGDKGWKSAYLEIEDYPITFDDILYFSFFVDEKINVLSINPSGENKYLNAFYKSDSIFNFNQQNYKSIDYKSLKNNQLVILNGLSEISSGLGNQLKTYVENGGNLFVFPPQDKATESINVFLQKFNAGHISGPVKTETRIKGIKLKNSLFSESIELIPENADLPVIFKKYNFKNNYTNNLETVISLLNGEAFLLKKEIGNGLLYLSAVSLSDEFSNLSTHSLFIPLMYGASIDGKGFQKMFYEINKEKEIRLNTSETGETNKDQVYHLSKTDSDKSFIPLQQIKGNKLILWLEQNIEQAGIYQLTMVKKQNALLSFNYNRTESIMEFNNFQSMEKLLKESKLKNYEIINLQSGSQEEIINSLQNQSRLWLVFIIFALSFLLLEILVLRFWP
jgi:hypothetical protein